MDGRRSGGDPLTAMYFVAAVLMAVVALTIVVLMFVPASGTHRSDPEKLWVPGVGPAYDMPDSVAVPPGERLSPEQEEELHLH